jgi:hypothetical protein
MLKLPATRQVGGAGSCDIGVFEERHERCLRYRCNPGHITWLRLSEVGRARETGCVAFLP